MIPWYPIKCTDQDYPPDIKFHPLKKDVSYRFWNPVSSHLLQRAGSEVTCQGGFSDSVNSESLICSHYVSCFFCEDGADVVFK